MKILVVLTGGTIGSKVEGKVIDVSSAAAYNLINLYEEKYGKDTEFEVVQPLNILSENLEPSHWEVLYKCLEQVDFETYDGIIITHGTDTLSYTAAMMGYCYRHASVPMILIASNYELQDARSNGLANFYNAVCFIKEQVAKGVYVLFQNDRKENIVYLSTRIMEADTYLDQFSSYGKVDFGRMIDGHFVRTENDLNPSMENMNSPKEKIVTIHNGFKKSVLMIHPYPGLDYTRILIDENVGAVLHCLYHSATACSSEGNCSAVDFIRKCKEKGITTYVSSFKQEANDLYATSIDILDAGAVPLINISTEAAFAKLVVAYNQQEMEPAEFMRENIYYEMLPAAKL
ncbi:MAG: asparaginase [Lachnospiraceae bacterium]|nr:asparaginase [Lachnospiraceae bacterium]